MSGERQPDAILEWDGFHWSRIPVDDLSADSPGANETAEDEDLAVGG